MQVRRTDEFIEWLKRLRDKEAGRRIELRLSRLALTGNFGDTRYVGGDVSEMRLHFGPGYCLYFTQQSGELILLLVGGDKTSQSNDILNAQRIAASLKQQED